MGSKATSAGSGVAKAFIGPGSQVSDGIVLEVKLEFAIAGLIDCQTISNIGAVASSCRGLNGITLKLRDQRIHLRRAQTALALIGAIVQTNTGVVLGKVQGLREEEV